MSELNKKAFSFIDDLNSINDDENLKVIIVVFILRNQIWIRKFWQRWGFFFGFRYENKIEKFQVGLFDKSDSFPFGIVRVPDKSSNVLSDTVYVIIDKKSLSKTRGINSPGSLSTTI